MPGKNKIFDESKRTLTFTHNFDNHTTSVVYEKEAKVFEISKKDEDSSIIKHILEETSKEL